MIVLVSNMSTRSNLFSRATLTIFLVHCLTQAYFLHLVPDQTIAKIDNVPRNGSAVPGDSPVKFHNDPGNDLFKIETLDMYPNPCVLESYCTVVIRGDFTTSLENTTPHLSLNVTSHLSNNRTGIVPGEDAFCNWVDVIQHDDDDDDGDDNNNNLHAQALAQDYAHRPHPQVHPDPLHPDSRRQKRRDKLFCPPKQGKAQISSTILLLRGYAPKANYTVKVKATTEGQDGEEGETIFDLWAEFELRDKNEQSNSQAQFLDALFRLAEYPPLIVEKDIENPTSRVRSRKTSSCARAEAGGTLRRAKRALSNDPQLPSLVPTRMTDLLHTLPNFPTKFYTHLIPSLEKNLITTTDLLTLDPLEIVKRAKLPLLDVRRLTNHVLASLQSQLGVIDGKEALRKYEDPANVEDAGRLRSSGLAIAERWSVISTTDPNLDAVLGGGIPTKYLTEVTGESGAGKTQFLLSLLLSTQLPPPHGLSRPTVYISTEHPLPTSRLAQILLKHPIYSSLPPAEKPSLNRIFSIQTPDLESQEHILTYQLPVLLQRHHVGLVVIDSIAANYRAECSSTSSSGAALGLRSTQLVKLGHQLRNLAREHDCAIVLSNQVADRFFPSPASPPPTHPGQQQRLMGSSPPSSSPASQTSQNQSGGMQSLSAALMRPPPLPPNQNQNQNPNQPFHSSPLTTTTTNYNNNNNNNPSSSTTYPPLTLDHQQNFFTGWSADPSTPFAEQNLKTPSLGLVWSNQLACRIALVKHASYSYKPVRLPTSVPTPTSASATTTASGGGGGGGGGSAGWNPRRWQRYMKVAFCAWAPSTGVEERGTEFEVWEGGVRAVVDGDEDGREKWRG
ncbi:MAG: hypothetical protein LQ350_001505 [Teloschistes chrysophthalmus]|nr:MAG: hypothetical protein LQ350_001505 [Niorma chrysophthalma]